MNLKDIDEQALDFCVDQSLKVFEDYAGREYFSYYVFDSVAGKSVYEMPPDVGLVRNVFYKEIGSFGFQSSDLDGAIPIEYYVKKWGIPKGFEEETEEALKLYK